MLTCRTQALPLLEEMVKLIREGEGKEERGFVACRRDGELAIGGRCQGDAHDCTLRNGTCPKGAKPVVSFHTHTQVPLLVHMLAEVSPDPEAFKVGLLPSVKDLKTDMNLGLEMGCVGGAVEENKALVWCWPREGLTAAKVGKVEAIHTAFRTLPKEGDTLMKFMEDYIEVIGRPCLEVRLALNGTEASSSPEGVG